MDILYVYMYFSHSSGVENIVIASRTYEYCSEVGNSEGMILELPSCDDERGVSLWNIV